MEPSFKTGNRVVMSRVMVYLKWLQRNDIVVCSASEKTDGKKIIKRIIGLPGDRIAIYGNKVYVNGEELNEPYTLALTTSGDIDIVLEDNEYFVMGDNRDVSRDSRHFGPVKKSDIESKVVFRYFPLNKLKFY